MVSFTACDIATKITNENRTCAGKVHACAVSFTILGAKSPQTAIFSAKISQAIQVGVKVKRRHLMSCNYTIQHNKAFLLGVKVKYRLSSHVTNA